MKIKADQEGITIITKLCDVALKAGGLDNMNIIQRVLASIKALETPEPAKADPVKDETLEETENK